MPILFGGDQIISPVCPLPVETELLIRTKINDEIREQSTLAFPVISLEPGRTRLTEIKNPLSVGFVFDRYHFWYLDLWTSSGRFVLFEGEMYWEFPPDAREQVLGKEKADHLQKPLRYRFPFAMVLLTGFCIGSFGRDVYHHRRARQRLRAFGTTRPIIVTATPMSPDKPDTG